MNILHYTIGLPPERHGGSVQYANDLIVEQSKDHNIFVLTCGDTLFKPSKVKFKFIGQRNNISVYSLQNPLTPTLIYGTANPIAQHRSLKIDFGNIKRFIEENKIEVFHMHTLMGMHRDLVKFIKELGVKVFYTTHDFHGICPHYNLIDFKGELCQRQVAEKCALCNLNEPSEFFLRVANSRLYQKLKSISFFQRHIKSNIHSKQNLSIQLSSQDYKRAQEHTENFEKLLEYYKEYFSLFDKIHFNSTQSKEIFTSFITGAKGEVINVITSGIKDRRKLISPSNEIKLGFIGSLKEYKGFPMLKRALMELTKEGIDNLYIKVYGGGREGFDEDCNKIEYCHSYSYDELSSILYHLDGTIVPSKWYETFSLVTLESLAHGRPTFISDHVGAKDIVSQYDSQYIFSSYSQLKDLLKRISNDKTMLMSYSKLIIDKSWDFSIENHAKKITEFYLS